MSMSSTQGPSLLNRPFQNIQSPTIQSKKEEGASTSEIMTTIFEYAIGSSYDHQKLSSISKEWKAFIDNHVITPTSIPPENKQWKKCRVLKLPQNTQIAYRSDRKISYTDGCSIITWSWETNAKETTKLEAKTLTALTELSPANLVAGDDEGRLYLKSRWHKLRKDDPNPISKIRRVDQTHCLIQFKDKTLAIFNIETKKNVRLGPVDEFIPLSTGTILTLADKKIATISIKPDALTKRVALDKNVCAIYQISKTTVALAASDHKEVTLWNVETDTRTIYNQSKLPSTVEALCRGLVYKNLIAFADGTLFFPDNARGSKRAFHLFEEGKTRMVKQTGGLWGISQIAHLSDDSIIYNTGDFNSSKLYVIKQNGSIAFSGDLGFSQTPDSFIELSDGSVAVRSDDTTLEIIRPKWTASKIERLENQLKQKPSSLQNYHELGALYTPPWHQSQKEKDAAYRVYLTGLARSMKDAPLYQARRFYRKARKIKPNDETLVRFFISYLEQTNHPKLVRRAKLDLYALQKNVPYIRPPLDPAKRCKTRLFVGEGDFSYTEALIKKHAKTHDQLPRSITATEQKKSLNKATRARLEKKGVRVLLGIDGTQLHTRFQGQLFKRIHWNCPFGKSLNEEEKFKKVIPQFFRSAAKLQTPGDRIHVTLMQEPGQSIKRQCQNPIFLGATTAKYRLIRKRYFGATRYPGYQHVTTSGGNHSDGIKREFVFEKGRGADESASIDTSERLINSQEKSYKIKLGKKEKTESSLENYYFECSTDEDSSDYYESDTETPQTHDLPSENQGTKRRRLDEHKE